MIQMVFALATAKTNGSVIIHLVLSHRHYGYTILPQYTNTTTTTAAPTITYIIIYTSITIFLISTPSMYPQDAPSRNNSSSSQLSSFYIPYQTSEHYPDALDSGDLGDVRAAEIPLYHTTPALRLGAGFANVPGDVSSFSIGHWNKGVATVRVQDVVSAMQ